MGKSKTIRKLGLLERANDRVQVPETILKAALSLYEAGRYVDACNAALEAGDLRRWIGAGAQTFAFRLANNTGAARLGALLINRAWREGPRDAEMAVHYGYYLQRRRGSVPVWRHCLAAEKMADAQPGSLADLKAMRATIAAGYRDFGTAWQLWEEASGLAGRTAWLQVERCSILLSEERREEAMEAVDEALAVRPWFRPAVQFRGRLLHLLGRYEDAVGFLSEARGRLQSCAVVAQLMSLKREEDDHSGMEELADEYERLAVLSDSDSDDWLAARRVDLLTLRGDHSRAAPIAARLPGDYYPALAARLAVPGVSGRRKRLAFEFVHQKHNTCAPATLAAAAHYWNMPVTMEQIVDAICYDGTYDHTERSWAQANGFAVREFTVTLEAARQLIDEGLPFVLHTVEVGSAHAQAVIGYDDLRETLFIQDPSEPHYREVEAVEFLERYKLTGPGGLVMVPREEAARLDAIILPDAEMYDLNHRFNAALAAYDRETAVNVLAVMEESAPGHRLALTARMSLANFDGNEVERLTCINRLLEDFPCDERLLNWKYHALRSMGCRDDRLRLLREVTREEGAPPAFCKNLVEELMDDARDWDEARLLAWRSHSRWPADAGLLVCLAEVLRRTLRAPVDEWLVCHRFAAAYADKVESVVQTWFAHSQSQGMAEEALQWLRERWRAYGAKSSGPAITLAQALDAMCRPEALEVLREAVAARPQDGELLLHLARMEARGGDHAKAASLLETAQGRCPPGQWQRACAALMRRFGDHAGEMQVWRQILELEPLALDAHGWVARELAATSGQDAALNHLADICARFPHHQGLAQLHIGWLRDADLQQAEQEIRRVISLHPVDPWAKRELALTLRELGRAGEAVEPAWEAVSIAPDQAASHVVMGLVLAADGRNDEAAAYYQHAIQLDVNNPSAFDGLLEARASTAAKRESLAFIRGEMIRQVLNGNALHAYQALAFTVLTPEELLAELREVWQARPDLWEAWSVLIAQMNDSGHKDEAVMIAQQATQKFALTPGAWRDMALIWKSTGHPDAALACARHVVGLNPDWVEGWCLLAEYLEDAGHGEEAVQNLETARGRLPLDMSLRRALAALLWRLDRREEAWDVAETVVHEDPGQNWAWGSLQNWADVMQRGERLVAFASRLADQRPDEARSWLILARLLPVERFGDILAALDKTIRLNPRLIDAYDFRMEMLARLGRLDEADAVPATGPWTSETMPHSLTGRQAWLQAVRGDLPGAMRRMRALLEKHRDYFWGWEMYAQWAEQVSDLPEWQRAAAELIRLAPRSPAAHCSAADVALRLGNIEGGIHHLWQALQADPSSPYAAQRLLGLYWDKRDITGLRRAASTLPATGTPALISRVYLMLAAAHQGELEQARADLEWLAVHPDMMGPLLKVILDFCSGQKKLAALLDETLNSTAQADTIGPAFAILWVRRETQKLRWQSWNALARWIPRLGQRLDSAVAHYLDAIGDARAADPHVVHFIQACGPYLRARGELWGKVSYALANSGAYRACAGWMEPDHLRQDAEGWALWNLSLSLRETMRPEKAEEVSIHVVTQGIRDATWFSHVSVAALGLTRRRDYHSALELLDHNPLPKEAGASERLRCLTARALAEVMPVSRVPAATRFRKFLAEARPLVSSTAFSVHDKADFDRAVDLMRKHTGVTLMPWQRPRARTPNERWKNVYGQGDFSRFATIAAVIVGLQLFRHCVSVTQPARRTNDAQVEEILRKSRSMTTPPLLKRVPPPPESSKTLEQGASPPPASPPAIPLAR
jgi:tetratricopeptide (TPR) repeat protein